MSRFRDILRKVVPVWLSDRWRGGPGGNSGLTPTNATGFSFLWALTAPLDACAEVLAQGVRAAWPGLGTPSALKYIGSSRGILRGYGTSETDDHYAMRLRAWLTTWQGAGSQLALAQQLHEYISNRPRVTIVNRAGSWVSVAQDGTVSTMSGVTWNWDGTSNPEDATSWSEQWVIIYPDPWAHRGAFGSGDKFGADGLGLGHLVTREESDAVRGIIADWKSAHTRVRTVIWTSDGTIFNPSDPTTMPDGQWGQWSAGNSGIRDNGARGKSHRNVTTCRYWEPN